VITIMSRKLSRVSTTLGVTGILAAALVPTASAATASQAPAAAPSWHTVFSLPNNNEVRTVVATGRTSGWAFMPSGTVAYERTGYTTWEKVALPEPGGAVNIAEATSPSDVWAADYTTSGTYVDRWDGRSWARVKGFWGQVTGLSVLAPDDVWVFGGLINRATGHPQGVFHFDGRGWTQVSSAFEGGYALNDRNVWTYSGTNIGHYNGRTWTEVNVAGLFPAKTPGEFTSPVLTGIVALAPDDVYATGNGPLGPHIANGVILHFDGRTWSRAARGGFISGIGQQLATDGQGGLWLSAENVEGPPQLFHYAVGQVIRVLLPGSTGSLTGSYSVSRIPGTTEVLSGGVISNSSNSTSRAVVFQSS
jgi:hypothetical protein